MRSFNARRLTDPGLLDGTRRIHVTNCDDFQGAYPQAMPTRLTVRTAAGKQYIKQVDYPLGHPKQPMSDREIEAKFRALVAGKLAPARAERLIAMLWNLDKLRELRAMMPWLRV